MKKVKLYFVAAFAVVVSVFVCKLNALDKFVSEVNQQQSSDDKSTDDNIIDGKWKYKFKSTMEMNQDKNPVVLVELDPKESVFIKVKPDGLPKGFMTYTLDNPSQDKKAHLRIEIIQAE